MHGTNGPSPVIRVVIADDHALVRAGIATLLGQTSDIQVVGEASDGEEAVQVVAEQLPDLVLMDLSMPGMDGSAATRVIHDAHPDVRVVIVSSYVDRVDVLGALEAGAVGYLLKDAHPDELLSGIRSAVSQGSPLAPKAAREVVDAWRDLREPSELTTRELDVLSLLGEGLPNKVIAQRLGIAEKTVKAHVTHIFEAIGVTDRTQAALWFGRHGLSPRHRQRQEQLRAVPPPDAARGN
jgi:DNA-binding NarL/FixJ family response regulator